MDISFFERNNTKILSNEPNAYEWWYADFIDKASGLSGVIIFYNGNLFSPAYIQSQRKSEGNFPENFPAISISIYKNNKPCFYSFLEFTKEEASYNENSNVVTYCIADNCMVFNSENRSLSIKLSQELASSDTIDLDLLFVPSSDFAEPNLNTPSVKNNSNHSWKCIIPSATVKGRIRVNSSAYIIERANGYHDHNAGLEPLHHFFRDWYWGRVHLLQSKETLIFYSYSIDKELRTNGWIIDNNGAFSSLGEASYKSFRKNLFGLNRATKIGLANRFEIDLQSIVDKGPFYERYLCDVTDLEEPLNNTSGIAEYIYPKNIYKSWVHRLVNLRLRYMYRKAHVVLRNSRLYKYTWKVL